MTVSFLATDGVGFREVFRPKVVERPIENPNNVRFDSKAEARRYTELKLLLKAKQISELMLHGEAGFELRVMNRDTGEFVVIGEYQPDFVYYDVSADKMVYEDVKGFKTPLYRWKKKHVEAQFGIQITEIR